jgi:hypothetical protein
VGNEKEEHDAVEELVSIISGPLSPIVSVALNQAAPNLPEHFAVILEELLGESLNVESFFYKMLPGNDEYQFAG